MLTIDASEAIAALNAMAMRIADAEPVLAAIGYAEVEVIRARIEEGKKSPQGEEWAPWRPWTESERKKKGNTARGLLWDSGNLMDSIRSEVSANGVIIGTDIEYGPELQRGRGPGDPYPMEARPFVGWDEQGKVHAEMLMVHHIQGFAS